MICHSLFGSHLLYGSQLWGQKTLKTQTTYQAFQTTVPLRKLPLALKNVKILLHVSN